MHAAQPMHEFTGMLRPSSFAVLLFAIVCVAGLALAYGVYQSAAPIAAMVVAIVTLLVATTVGTAVKIAAAWERAVVLRLGEFRRFAGQASSPSSPSSTRFRTGSTSGSSPRRSRPRRR